LGVKWCYRFKIPLAYYPVKGESVLTYHVMVENWRLWLQPARTVAVVSLNLH
jgi:hypothetical protein